MSAASIEVKARGHSNRGYERTEKMSNAGYIEKAKRNYACSDTRVVKWNEYCAGGHVGPGFYGRSGCISRVLVKENMAAGKYFVCRVNSLG